MPHIFITDLKPGDRVSQFFLVKKKERRRARTGKDYLDLLLADRSGVLGAKIWSESLDQYEPLFQEGQFAGIAGRVETYQDEFQLIIDRIKGIQLLEPEQLTKAGFDLDLLVPAANLDIPALWSQLLAWVEQDIESPPLKELTRYLLKSHETAWTNWPASKIYHHAYKGGLLEHTCRVVQLARVVVPFFPDLNQSLVLSGAILHDIGKIKELEGVLSAENTLEGQLLGHLALGLEMVRQAAREITWEDPRLLIQLEHILLAHHGQLEFGSPVIPQTREAFLVHTLDDLEGKLKMMSDHLEQDRGQAEFTDWHRALRRKLFKDRPASRNETENAG